MTGTTSSTLEITVHAGGRRLDLGAPPPVPGRGALEVKISGARPRERLVLEVGDRELQLTANDEGEATWWAPSLLDEVAGELRIRVQDQQAVLTVRPSKLVEAELAILVRELEAVAEGLALSAGGSSALSVAGSRDALLRHLDEAVGLAASAAPAVRRRPIHRTREEVRAVPRDGGARSARDVRWLATHPVAALRAGASGRPVGVSRTRHADLDTYENRGVLATYDKLSEAALVLRERLTQDVATLDAARPAREAFTTETGNLWAERDAPRRAALERRRVRLDGLKAEVAEARRRSGLPDLRPRASSMTLTPRVEAEPAYWATFCASRLCDLAATLPPSVAPAPVRTLDELWEQWCAVRVAEQIATSLGSPSGGLAIDAGWFATLRSGLIATWRCGQVQVDLLYEPEISTSGELRKLHRGRPWRPDLVIDVRRPDGGRDLHVLDAKYRRESGAEPWTAFDEVWVKYGDSIGDEGGWPLVRSVWILWPGRGLRLRGPRMLDPAWPRDRLRGGAIGLQPGEAPETFPIELLLRSSGVVPEAASPGPREG